MLYYKSIKPQTLELLKKLMQIKEFRQLRLAGGTSLAMQMGHRRSIDIDLFGLMTTDELDISKILKNIGHTTILKKTSNIFIYLIDGIKVDLVNYHYPWLEKAVSENDLRLAGKKDIAAMKLAAITGRGTKKDFIDIFFLFKIYSLKEMIDFYKRKYHDASEILVLKSLAYFEDADAESQPDMLVSMNWNKVKTIIKQELTEYINNLSASKK